MVHRTVENLLRIDDTELRIKFVPMRATTDFLLLHNMLLSTQIYNISAFVVCVDVKRL